MCEKLRKTNVLYKSAEASKPSRYENLCAITRSKKDDVVVCFVMEQIQQ